MAEQNEPKRKRSSMTSMYMRMYQRSLLFRFLHFIRVILGTGIVVFLIWFCLSGGINYVKTGETFVEYALDIGHNVGYFLESLFTEDSPLKYTEDGVYFKDADVPEGSAVDKEDLPGQEEIQKGLQKGEETLEKTKDAIDNVGEDVKEQKEKAKE